MYATLSRVVSKPDLIVQGISTSPNTPYEGQNVSVTITVKNQGWAAAGAFSVDFYKNRTTGPAPYTSGDFACAKSGLAAGATDTCSGTVSYAAVGAYQMWAQVDTYQQVTESDEANNLFGPQSITVNYAPGADLVITAVTGPTTAAPGSIITIGDTTWNQGTGTAAASTTMFYRIGADLLVSALTAPASATAGSTITVTDTTKNSGASTAVASTTKIYLSQNNVLNPWDTALGSRSVPSLAPLATNAGGTSVAIPSGLAPGAYYLIGAADATGRVPESNEGNNIKTKAITITAP